MRFLKFPTKEEKYLVAYYFNLREVIGLIFFFWKMLTYFKDGSFRVFFLNIDNAL